MNRPLSALATTLLALSFAPAATAAPPCGASVERPSADEAAGTYRARCDLDERRAAELGDRSKDALARAVVDELNLMRRAPAAYAAKLRALRAHFDGETLRVPGRTPVLTVEGAAAVDEAIAALERIEPMPRVAWSEGLARAAADHARDLAESGRLSHEGSDGSSPSDRARRHGEWRGAVAENITFGATRADEIVIDLLVDDGVTDRQHRAVMFARDLRVVGVACGPHPTYRQACVLDFAASFSETAAKATRPTAKPKRAPRELHAPEVERGSGYVDTLQ